MSVYGYCLKCGAEVASRTRGIPSMDTCRNGHTANAALTLTAEMKSELGKISKAAGEALKSVETQEAGITLALRALAQDNGKMILKAAGALRWAREADTPHPDTVREVYRCALLQISGEAPWQ